MSWFNNRMHSNAHATQDPYSTCRRWGDENPRAALRQLHDGDEGQAVQFENPSIRAAITTLHVMPVPHAKKSQHAIPLGRSVVLPRKCAWPTSSNAKRRGSLTPSAPEAMLPEARLNVRVKCRSLARRGPPPVCGARCSQGTGPSPPAVQEVQLLWCENWCGCTQACGPPNVTHEADEMICVRAHA